jgi:FAD binding domain
VRAFPDPSPDAGTVQSMPPSVDTHSPRFALAQQKCRRLVPGLFGPMGPCLAFEERPPRKAWDTCSRAWTAACPGRAKHRDRAAVRDEHHTPARHPETVTTTTDILIVGAGPKGLALAAQLNAFGVKARIVDRPAGGHCWRNRAATVHFVQLAQTHRSVS